GSFVSAAIALDDALTFAPRVLVERSRFNLCSGSGERCMARTVHDSRRARLAPMGRMDSAVLSVRCPRSLEESVVPLRLLASCRRNVQRPTVIRCAFFCFLAVMAKKVHPCAAHARRLHSDDGAHGFAVGFAHSCSMDRRCRDRRYLYAGYFPLLNCGMSRVDSWSIHMRCVW